MEVAGGDVRGIFRFPGVAGSVKGLGDVIDHELSFRSVGREEENVVGPNEVVEFLAVEFEANVKYVPFSNDG